MPDNQILEQILEELRAIHILLLPTVTEPNRTATEHDEAIIRVIDEPAFNSNSYSSSTMLFNSATSFTEHAQPAPPPLPVTTSRVTWLPEHEQIITDATVAGPGTYRNSFKRICDKLPKTFSKTSIRNKINKMGYKLTSGYIHIKQEATNG